MTPRATSLQALRSDRPLRWLLLWAFVALVLLKAAVPLLAAMAADARDVAVGEVCSVYGVRPAQPPNNEPAPHDPGQHAGSDHCALSPALGAALSDPAALPAVVLHAPPRQFTVPASIAVAPPIDRPLDWLVEHTHAPPPLG